MNMFLQRLQTKGRYVWALHISKKGKMLARRIGWVTACICVCAGACGRLVAMDAEGLSDTPTEIMQKVCDDKRVKIQKTCILMSSLILE